MIRKDVYEKSGGHIAIRECLADDFALARRVMGCGHRFAVYKGPVLCEVQMYRSFREFCCGWTRLIRTGFRELKPIATTLSLAPLFALNLFNVLSATPLAWIPPLVTMLIMGILQRQLGRFTLSGIFLLPFSILTFVAISITAAVQQIRREPISWRGRTYSSIRSVTDQF